jgi:hypothetical protein
MFRTLVRLLPVAALALSAGFALADIDPVQVTLDNGYLSKYIWRGFNYHDNGCTQSSATLTSGKFSLNIWGNYNHGRHTGDRFSESDYTLSFEDAFGDWNYSLGYVYYDNHGLGSVDSQEFYVGVGNNRFFGKPQLTWNRDFDKGDVDYFSLDFGHQFSNKKNGLPVTLTYGVGYNQHQWRAAEGWSDVHAGLVTPVRVTKGIVLTPGVYWSKSLDRVDFKSYVYGGVGIRVGY